MPPQPIQIVEDLQRNAKLCETIAQDKTEESRTGASCDQEKNEMKSKVWLEAEAAVRLDLSGQAPPVQ